MTEQPERTLPPARTPAGLPPEPGQTLGPFRLLSLLGEGGMGRVFVAEDGLTRRVALKVMKPDAARDERARRMFLREARSAAIIRHDRIVTVYEAGEAAGVPYIAMELLDGEPLDRFLRRTPVPPPAVALTIAYQVAEGLHAAHTHEQRLIHRDVKPANVWLRSAPGRAGIDVRLLDFGLARATGGDTLSTGGAGKALGTPLYMAPEQWDGKGVDHQSDVYSLGVVLYQMLTGGLPFRGEGVKELMFNICMPTVLPPPPAAVNPAVPADVSDFVLRMVARRKADRVATAADVMRAVAGFLAAAGGGSATTLPTLGADVLPALRDTHGPASVTRQTDPFPRPARRWPWAAAGVAVAAAVAAVFVASRPAMTEAARVAPPPRSAPVTEPPPESPVVRSQMSEAMPPPRPAPLPVAPAVVAVEPAPPPRAVVRMPPPGRVARAAPVPVGPPPPGLDCGGLMGASEAAARLSRQQWARHLGVPEVCQVDLGDGVVMEFVLVPPGAFFIGSNVGELNRLARHFGGVAENFRNEMPAKSVTLTRPVYVGRTEVTRGQFARFAATGYVTEAERTDGGFGWNLGRKTFVRRDRAFSWRETGWPADDSHPVVNVTWDDAKAFAGWVQGHELPPGFGAARLPREAEWEYACRAGTRAQYPNGSDDPRTLVQFANVADAALRQAVPDLDTVAGDDGHPFTAPAGRSPRNRFGLSDMLGNVCEWCEDGYDPWAYRSPGWKDPFVEPAAGGPRVFRGGSWRTVPFEVRPGFRAGADPATRDDQCGFRLVLAR